MVELKLTDDSIFYIFVGLLVGLIIIFLIMVIPKFYSQKILQIKILGTCKIQKYGWIMYIACT